MKKSTKLMATAIAAAAIFIGTNVKAQTTESNPWRFGIGVEAGAPTGNAHNVSNFELGGTARLQYGADKGLAYTLTSGYYNMFGKEIGNTGVKYPAVGVVPVKLGIKAFLADRVYFGAEAGAGFETNSGGNTKLIVSPGLGYASKSVDVGVRYENFSGQGSNYGLVGLRVAYGFGL
ncbi:MAG: hypothetical protein V4592_12745 [Bacteroidota bacterium]